MQVSHGALLGAGDDDQLLQAGSNSPGRLHVLTCQGPIDDRAAAAVEGPLARLIGKPASPGHVGPAAGAGENVGRPLPMGWP